MQAIVLSFLLFFVPLCANSTSDEVLNQLLLKEMNDWLNDYDEKGVLNKDLFKVDILTIEQIRKSNAQTNSESFQKNYQEVMAQKAWLEASLLSFRQTQFEFSQSLRKEESELENQQALLDDRFTKNIKATFDSSYQKMIQLGFNLQKIINKDNQ